VKYDDASWHYGGEFPKDLSPDAGATHIGMFVVWAMLNGMAGSIHTDDFPEMLSKIQNRELTPGSWFIEACDEKFTDEDLNSEANEFARVYYAKEDGLKTGPGSYLADYEAAFPHYSDLYRVPDSWETFDKIGPIISRRYVEWRNHGSMWSRLFRK